MGAPEDEQSPEGFDRPPVEFWQDTLECPVTRLMEDARSPEFLNDWIRQRSARQVAMLRHLLGLPVDAPLQERKAQLKDRHAELTRFVPAALFALRKSVHATLDVAVGCLDEPTIGLAQESDDSYDTAALIFGILDRSWRDLEEVFHLDKLHKVGFARMRLPKPPRRPARRFKDFLASGELLAVLGRFDADQRDRHTSQFQQVIEVRDGEVVFIRRPHQQRYVLAEDRVVHGFSPDQIILDFRDEAARLNIASHDHAASYEIANRLASAFYGQDCEYENITEETFAAQIARFLRVVRDDEARDLRLVEIRLRAMPLHGAPDLVLSNKGDLSLGRALGELEQALHWTMDDLDRIPGFKMLFNDKRVSMEIERIEDGPDDERKYVLRYRDQSLTLNERLGFEELIEQNHGIKVVSTEKRGARGRRTRAA
jgi:hypothetical protein